MKLFRMKGRSRRQAFFTAGGILGIILLLVFHFWFTNFAFVKGGYIDLTREGRYTLSDTMIKECAFVATPDADGAPTEVKITFCADPDALLGNQRTRLVYMMCLAMQRQFPNIHVQTVNILQNPTAVSMYKTTSLTTLEQMNLIIDVAGSYRITHANAFWSADAEENLTGFNGERKLATLLMSLLYNRRPVAYFVTDMGTTYYDPDNKESAMSLETAALADLLTEVGLRIDTLKLSEAEQIPEDCMLLIINDPTVDLRPAAEPGSLYAVSDAEKIDRYLVNRQGSLCVTKDYRITLPCLEDLLSEWGFTFGNSQVKDEGSSLADAENSHSTLVGVYNTDEDSVAGAIYGDFAKLLSAPRFVLEGSGYVECSYQGSFTVNEPGTRNVERNYDSFFATTEEARAYDYSNVSGAYTDFTGKKGSMDLAALATRYRLDATDLSKEFSYVFCAASGDFFSSSVLGNASLANFDVSAALIKTIARVDKTASMELGGNSWNSSSYGGKLFLSTELSDTGFTEMAPGGAYITHNAFGAAAKGIVTALVAALPVAVLVAGILVHLRRRHL